MQQTPDLVAKRVFIVEDESLVAMLLEDMLSELGCSIAGMAASYADACRKAEHLHFDVAVLDVNLDGVRSYPLAYALNGRGVPLVLSTGYGVESLPDSLRDVPVVQKPFHLDELRHAVSEALALV